MYRRFAALLVGCLAVLVLGTFSPASAEPVDCTEAPTDPACVDPTAEPSPSLEPTGSPSPSESSTPDTGTSPTPMDMAETLPADCSEESPCVVVLGDDPVLHDWLLAMGTGMGAVVMFVSIHAVGSWRR